MDEQEIVTNRALISNGTWHELILKYFFIIKEKNCLKRFDKAELDELFESLIKIDRNDFSISFFQRDFIFSRT